MCTCILLVYCIHELFFFGGMQESTLLDCWNCFQLHRQNTCLPKAIGNVQNLLAGRSASLLFRFDMHCCFSSPFICCEIHGWGMIWHRWLRLQWPQFVLAKRDWTGRKIFGNKMILLTWECLKKFFVESNLIVDVYVCAPQWALLESLV